MRTDLAHLILDKTQESVETSVFRKEFHAFLSLSDYLQLALPSPVYTFSARSIYSGVAA